MVIIWSTWHLIQISLHFSQKTTSNELCPHFQTAWLLCSRVRKAENIKFILSKGMIFWAEQVTLVLVSEDVDGCKCACSEFKVDITHKFVTQHRSTNDKNRLFLG